MGETTWAEYRCRICGQPKPERELLPAALVRGAVSEAIRRNHPDWSEGGYICLEDLNRYRTQHVREALAAERGELTRLETDVLASIHDQEVLTQNTDHEFDRNLTFGERVADGVAEFGGSWRFILSFAAVLVLWVAANSAALLWRPWDPYPFILLNLVLSCLAAVQAPVIMMSQNRQEAKDRLRAENDYKVNLKAELEIRSIHAKLDLLLSHQWQRLLEIQEIQTEMMEELVRRGAEPTGPGEDGAL